MDINDLRTCLLDQGPFQQPFVLPREGKRLHAMLTSCGIQEAQPPSYDWDGLKRGRAEFVVFQYSLAGCGQLHWERRELAVPPGHAMLVRIPHAHRYRVHPESESWQFLYICLNGREVLRAVADVHASHGPVLPLAPNGPTMLAAAAIAEHARDGAIASPFRASALAYSLAMSLLEETGGTTASPPTRRVTQPAADYCRNHLRDEVTVATLARVCDLSQWHFSRVFKSEHGLTPNAFLQVERIREAARLLRDTDEPLKVIAAECGFLDANYLGKVFRRQMGVSPGEFRRSGV
jgi:AraC-like DNA-binding protein